jgi:hypothetical protein
LADELGDGGVAEVRYSWAWHNGMKRRLKLSVIYLRVRDASPLKRINERMFLAPDLLDTGGLLCAIVLLLSGTLHLSLTSDGP